MAEITRIYPHWGQAPEPLWREVLGSRLRALRTERAETLAGTAERAGISPQYLSEIERGRKEPSSEMIAALAGALDTSLADLTFAVTEDLRRLSGVGVGTGTSIGTGTGTGTGVGTGTRSGTCTGTRTRTRTGTGTGRAGRGLRHHHGDSAARGR
jgi:DNA-binding XRE family transcriptional regulator